MRLFQLIQEHASYCALIPTHTRACFLLCAYSNSYKSMLPMTPEPLHSFQERQKFYPQLTAKQPSDMISQTRVIFHALPSTLKVNR